MTLEKALDQVAKEYAAAAENERIHNPLAYALYQVWKKADAEGTRQPNLDGKCGSCAYSKPNTDTFGSSKSYVECTNPAHLEKIKGRGGLVHIRQRTCKACKEYKRRADA